MIGEPLQGERADLVLHVRRSVCQEREAESCCREREAATDTGEKWNRVLAPDAFDEHQLEAIADAELHVFMCDLCDSVPWSGVIRIGEPSGS